MSFLYLYSSSNCIFFSLQVCSSIDPAQVLCLFNIIWIHLIQLFVLILPHFQPISSNNFFGGVAFIFSFIQFFDDKKIYLLYEFLLLSIGALVVLLNSVIHSKVVDLEMERRRVYSIWERLSTVAFFGLSKFVF